MSPSQRSEILIQARRLFLEQGYTGLAMRSIAEAVGVTKAALYYHFEDKEELFLAVVADYLDEMEKLLDRIMAAEQSAPQRLRLLVQGLLEMPVDQRALMRLVSQGTDHLSPDGRQRLEEDYHQQFISRIAAMIEEGMQRGELRRLPVQTALWALLGMLYPFVYPSHLIQVSEDDLQAIVSLYLEGITAPAVRRS